MDKFKGTPGPWFTYHTGKFHDPQGWLVKELGGVQVPIGMIYEPRGGKKNEEGVSPIQKANAQLIAAAPELLDALETAIRFITLSVPHEKQPRGLEKWQAVVAKALGKEVADDHS